MGRTKLFNLWIAMQGSFWFIPSVMIIGSLCISIVTIELDRIVEYQDILHLLDIKEDSLVGNYFNVGPEGARAVLTSIAGSMITVAGVTFSVTIVTLTLAASQFGPRLLGNFMEDKSTQVVLGTFNSTFIYCLLVLRSVQTTREEFFVPTLSVNIAVLFAIINVAVLTYFIHHIAVSIKAENVIDSVYSSLKASIDRIFRETEPDDEDSAASAPRSFDLNPRFICKTDIRAGSDGYIQAIDQSSLMTFACENDLKIQLLQKAGEYATATTCIATVESEAELEDNVAKSIRSNFIYGNQRTQEQDVEYAIHQLVEVAVRSLSPGINDPFTAVSCIDYLGSALCYLSQKKFPDSSYYDEDGVLRLHTKPVRIGDILDAAFNQIRQHSSSSVTVIIRLLDTFMQITESLTEREQRDELTRHVKMLKRTADMHIKEKDDLDDFNTRYEDVITELSRVWP